MKRFTHKIYSKYRKLRTETICLTTKTWRLLTHVAWRLTCVVWRLHFTIGRLDKLTAVHCKRRTSTRTSSNGCPKLLPISDNVSVIIQGVLVLHLILLINRTARTFHGSWLWFDYKRSSYFVLIQRNRVWNKETTENSAFWDLTFVSVWTIWSDFDSLFNILHILTQINHIPCSSTHFCALAIFKGPFTHTS